MQVEEPAGEMQTYLDSTRPAKVSLCKNSFWTSVFCYTLRMSSRAAVPEFNASPQLQ